MKNIILIIALFFAASAIQAQHKVTIEPLFELGVFTGRSQNIINPATNKSFLVPETHGDIKGNKESLIHRVNGNIDYHVTVGFRVNFRGFVLESENKTYCTTNNFMTNKPYSAEFYARCYYQLKKFRVGIEHLCVHPIVSNGAGNVYTVSGGHDKVSISYNIK